MKQEKWGPFHGGDLLVYRRVIKGYFLSIARFISDLLPTGPPKDPTFLEVFYGKEPGFFRWPKLKPVFIMVLGAHASVSYERVYLRFGSCTPNFGENQIFPPRLGLPADCEETFQVVSSVVREWNHFAIVRAR